ncbi:MAG: hypothetical protein HN979_06815 [Actinobacteria bacterium]|nr:hypothetical protein [Actinomycetota bacterium]MBT3687880.1 hypothetical protein [Actinomycetota bacterium]MBT4036603.1 hypothetical protein [Actinomycetota bacterium]MBT4278658.1 hypothetical protein [Actinomycetota bacterium]MBT4342452.1 hypothetical protein [Actinomycetota bacterium]
MTGSVSDVLEAASAEGFVTPSAADAGVDHSTGFLRRGVDQTPIRLDGGHLGVDIGSGGGLPGLVLAGMTDGNWVLVDRADRRCTFLKWAVGELDLADRVEVICGDVVDLARGSLRGVANLVTARGFGSPATTVECAAPLLSEGGRLVVSEPPSGGSRWSQMVLDELDLVDEGAWHVESATYRAFLSGGACPERYPRRNSRQVADPLF